MRWPATGRRRPAPAPLTDPALRAGALPSRRAGIRPSRPKEGRAPEAPARAELGLAAAAARLLRLGLLGLGLAALRLLRLGLLRLAAAVATAAAAAATTAGTVDETQFFLIEVTHLSHSCSWRR